MQSHEKLIALFGYTRELFKLKSSTVTDIKNQPFVMHVNEIPRYEQYTSFSYRDFVETDDVEDENASAPPLLRIQKPEFQKCPQPDHVFRTWLEDGWDDYNNIVAVIHVRETAEEFSQCKIRTKAYETWLTKRVEWIKNNNRSKSVFPCPPPPAGVQEWLVDGWNSPHEHVSVIPRRSVVVERFEDSPQRRYAFDAWMEKRADWANEQTIIEAVRNCFSQLFNVHTDLSRESETLELMVGNVFITASLVRR
jgi:hypothetical protein